jgi:hypothetical protein
MKLFIGAEEEKISASIGEIRLWLLRAETLAGAWVSHDGVRWRLGRPPAEERQWRAWRAMAVAQ